VALSPADRQRRSRAHKRGDHSLCDPERCGDVTPPVTEPAVTAVTEPVTHWPLVELGPRGRRLYAGVVDEHPDLSARARVVLEEAARVTDRLETLDRMLRGDVFVWAHVETGALGRRELVVDKTLAEVRQQQGTLARLMGELRQALTPAGEKPATPVAPAAPATGQKPPGGGSGIVNLAARIAARRAGTAG
jgi:hypothetical protein